MVNRIIGAALLAASISACTTTETMPTAQTPPIPTEAELAVIDREAFVAAGAEQFSMVEAIGDGPAVATFPNGMLSFSADGAKVFARTDGMVTERQWERNADGAICEEDIRDAFLRCMGTSDWGVYRLGDEVIAFQPSGEQFLRLRAEADGQFAFVPPAAYAFAAHDA